MTPSTSCSRWTALHMCEITQHRQPQQCAVRVQPQEHEMCTCCYCPLAACRHCCFPSTTHCHLTEVYMYEKFQPPQPLLLPRTSQTQARGQWNGWNRHFPAGHPNCIPSTAHCHSLAMRMCDRPPLQQLRQKRCLTQPREEQSLPCLRCPAAHRCSSPNTACFHLPALHMCGMLQQ